MDTKELLIKIDTIHERGHAAIQKKNLEEYLSIFSDELEYTLIDGKTIDKAQLLIDQKAYFSRLVYSNSRYERLSFELKGNEFEEILQQNAEIAIRVFIFLKKTWKVSRKGIYSWTLHENDFKIKKVKILEEKIS
jgi:hypothetical protein